MRIQRIDLCGFKSFNQRVVISFDDGITGIVGPNGCGKSNVVDAIRWVMGEQSAKHLRGRSMEDVIFNGSETQGPSGMAEVALTLHNDRPSELPAQYQGFGEITVARRLYRDGRSEYLINKTASRLMDITELFLGTGVGTRAYSIIEQGKVGLIVNSKPEDRRALLEEAAGITKYKARKKLAERKLEYTDQNLLRVGDIVGEMKRQIAGLERQARKAERYRELKDEVREIELHAAAADWLEAQAALTFFAAEIEGASESLEAKITALAQAETRKQVAQHAVAGGDEAVETLRHQAHALALEAQSQTQARAFAVEQQAQLARRLAQLGRDEVTAQERASVLVAERGALEELLASLEEQAQRDQLALGDLAAQATRWTDEEAALRQSVDRERSSASQAETQAAGLRSRLAADDRRHAELSSRAERLATELLNVEAQRAALGQELARCTGQTEETRQLRLQLASSRDELEQSLVRARALFEQNEKQRRQTRDELADHGSRLKSLADLQRNLEGHARGVRSVLQGETGKPAFEGIRGLLADTFQAPKEIEQALEAYLANRLQDVVVEQRSVGEHGAAFLKESNGGRATFLPLDVPTAGALASPAHPGCLGRAVELVQVHAGAEAVVEQALGRVWVVASALVAKEVLAQGFNGDLVTVEGDIYWGGGAITAGALEGAGIGALSQRREIDELTRTVAELQGQIELAQQRHATLSQQIAADEGTLKSLTRDAQSQEVALAHQQQDVRRMTEQFAALQKRSAEFTSEQQAIQKSLDELAQEQEAVRRALAQAEQTAREGKERFEAQALSLKELAALATQARERLTELKVKLASDSQRSQSTTAQLDRNQSLGDELRARAAAAAQEADQSHARTAELADAAVANERRLGEIEAQAAEVAGALAIAIESQAEHARLVGQIEETLRGLRAQQEASRTSLGKLQLRERETTLSLQHLIDTVRERHAVELGHEVARFHYLPLPTPDRSERLIELREAVARMGEINLAAIQEHAEISQRYEVLAQQKLDLEHSVAQLREAIVRINRTSRERFRETFELVNARFAEVFPRLFRGGKAGLVLIEEGGDVLEAGVEIFAQPPGKRLQSVDLLSGGEKALTAVALIFAIFLIKPTPFCLLDEVDAPLDEGNVGRYNDIVREISKISQFILITHNKRTMEIADTLYGVTMEEPGCSKLVSVKFNGNTPVAVAA